MARWLTVIGWGLVVANAISLIVLAICVYDVPLPSSGFSVSTGTFWADEGAQLRVEQGRLVSVGGGEFGWSTTEPTFHRIQVGLVGGLVVVCACLLLGRGKMTAGQDAKPIS